MIKIELMGSFPSQRGSFSAMKHGHAAAVADAIQWLSAEVLPRAIAQDHELQAGSYVTAKGYGSSAGPGCQVYRVDPPDQRAAEAPRGDWRVVTEPGVTIGIDWAAPAPSNRWPDAPTEWHAELDRRLAEQLKSGGQDCVAARSLLVRSERLRREEAEREYREIRAEQHGWITRKDEDANDRRIANGNALTSVQPGPLLQRHELPDEQRMLWRRR